MPQSGRCNRIFGFLFSLILAFGVALAPCKAPAQEAAPAAKPDSSSASQETAKPEKKSADDVFRLEGPLVKMSSKALNLSPETTANIFEFINFGILFLAIGIPLARFMPKVFRKRSQSLSASLVEARKETESANARLSAIEAKLSGLDEEIAKIRAQVEQESAQDEARIKASIEEESVRIVAAAEQEIGVAALHARRELRNFAAGMAIEQAAKQLVLTAETDRALIAEFVAGVTANGAAGNGASGGQN
jgi:F-type H+-transporting ATPase subunit b